MATVPVAATSSATSPVVAGPVRYWVVDAALAGKSADRDERGTDADGRQRDDGEDLQLHVMSPVADRSDRAPLGGRSDSSLSADRLRRT